MLEIRRPVSDDVTVTLSRHDTYTDANATRRKSGATLAVIDAQPVDLELWELLPPEPSDVDALFGTDPPENWVYVNTLTVTVVFTLSETDDYDDTDPAQPSDDGIMSPSFFSD